MCLQQSCIQCACHYYGSSASVIKSVPYYVVSTSLIRCVKLRSGISGRFKRPGHWGLTSPLCRILPQKIFKNALYVFEPPPPFLLLEFVNSVSVFWLLIFFSLFVYLPRERLICVIHAPLENILDAHLIIFYPIQTILELIRSFRRKNRLVKHSSPVDEGGGSNFVLSAKTIFHWTKWVNFLGDDDHEKSVGLWCPCLRFAESHSLHNNYCFAATCHFLNFFEPGWFHTDY